MKEAPIPLNDEARLKSLREYHLLDTLPEKVYDDITRLAIEISGTSISAITLVDKDRQWFKSRQGLPQPESSRSISFCAHAINTPGEPLVVPDARYDERFQDNPFTTSEPQIIFYAGVPIVTDDGYALGTLCVMDSRPREISDQKLEALKALSKLVMTHFELRKTKSLLEQQRKAVQKAFPIIDQITGELHQLSSQPNINNTSLLFQQLDSLKALLNSETDQDRS